MPTTMTYTGHLTITSCWCGIHVAIPSDLYRQATENAKTVYCPLGHTFVWRETETDRLRAQLDQAQADAKWKARQLEQARTERDIERGKALRTNQRIARGVCPCCNRSFANVARHMAGQHPDFDGHTPYDDRRHPDDDRVLYALSDGPAVASDVCYRSRLNYAATLKAIKRLRADGLITWQPYQLAALVEPENQP